LIFDAGQGRGAAPGMVSIAAAAGAQRATLAKFSHLDRGVFTLRFTSLLKGEPELSPKQITAGLLSC
jgi:hypothetical protein